jgi:multisubunit Na+/H+ antiporter MnhC subunit
MKDAIEEALMTAMWWSFMVTAIVVPLCVTAFVVLAAYTALVSP